LPLTGFGPGSTTADGGAVYDVFHCNSIDVDPANGDPLVSAREMDSVFYVDRPSGKVLWKMGGATASKDGATYVAVSDPFFRQHDAHAARLVGGVHRRRAIRREVSSTTLSSVEVTAA
jgi:hypothetical protein